MNIKILDSWLREHLETKATSQKLAEILSLASVSVEKIEKVGNDHLYDIEVTTNRPDLMSVTGLAREAAVSLSAQGIPAKFIEKNIPTPKKVTGKFPIEIVSDPKLVSRICAAVLTVKIDKSPQIIRDRLEASDIRSLNNVIDVTNYIMREMGQPIHVFDFDRLKTQKLKIREAKIGENFTTLDKKVYEAKGGEVVADNGKGEIVDLLSIMGTANSVVTDTTTTVLLFVDNVDKHKIRNASMGHGIRTDAAILNEKGIDPTLAYLALSRGIQLLEEIAGAKLTSPVLDLYTKKPTSKNIVVTIDKIREIMGVQISEKQVKDILDGLGFETKTSQGKFSVTPPSPRAEDILIPEDVIEEVARMYGYHNIPNLLPPLETKSFKNFTDSFFWEKKIKDMMKYRGFTEVYTYSFVSENLLEIDINNAVTIANPLSKDLVYLRTSLIPSLLQAVQENENSKEISIFEMSNVYHKKENDLPNEISMLSGIVKKENVSFYEVKGIIETIISELGIKNLDFKKKEDGDGAHIYLSSKSIGMIEIFDKNLIDFELNFDELLKHASNKKTFKALPKYPSAIEDLRISVSSGLEYEEIVKTIKSGSKLVSSVELLDEYEDKKTFRITYRSLDHNLTAKDITDAREKIISVLKKDLNANIS